MENNIASDLLEPLHDPGEKKRFPFCVKLWVVSVIVLAVILGMLGVSFFVSLSPLPSTSNYKKTFLLTPLVIVIVLAVVFGTTHDSSAPLSMTGRAALANGAPFFCKTTKCNAGQGDCNSDAECIAPNLCRNNVGSSFGFTPLTDVCLSNGASSFCSSSSRCFSGQGDCDSDAECAPPNLCRNDVGAHFGFSSLTDVCLPKGAKFFCSASSKCAIGEGDCTLDSECAAGLKCGSKNGAY
jgi:hypothetical protein